MVALRTTIGIRNLKPTSLQVESVIAIHVKHDTESSRARKMRRVLLRNILSKSFNNRWKGFFTGDIVTKGHVWPGLLPVEVFIVILEEYHKGHHILLHTDQLVHVQGIVRIQVENLCHHSQMSTRLLHACLDRRPRHKAN